MTVLKAPRSPHARLGASSAHRWMKCPGSIRMSEGLPRATTIYQVEGTAAHALAAHALLGEDWRRITQVDVELEEGGIWQVPVTDQMQEAVALYRETVLTLQRQYPGSTLHVEQTFNLSVLAPPEPMFGTADAVILAPNHVFVVDLKYGQGVSVEVDDNEQLMTYAVGALVFAAGSDSSLVSGNSDVTIIIVQPRMQHIEGSIRSQHLTSEEVHQFAIRLIKAAEKTQSPTAVLVPGEKQCRFCPAAAHCPALSQAAQESAADAFALAPIDAPELLPDVERMDINAVAELLSRAPLVRTFINALEQRVEAALKNGEPVPGFKLVAKKPRRQWTIPEAEVQDILDANFDEDDIYERRLRSPAAFEKRIGKPVFRQLIEQFNFAAPVSSGVTVVPVDNPRPAVTPAEVAFPALPAPEDDVE